LKVINTYLIVNFNGGILCTCPFCSSSAYISVDGKTQQSTCGVKCKM